MRSLILYSCRASSEKLARPAQLCPNQLLLTLLQLTMPSMATTDSPAVQPEEAAPVSADEVRAKEQADKLAEIRALLATKDGQDAAANLVQGISLRIVYVFSSCVNDSNGPCCSHAGGELAEVAALLEECFLRRWLRARRWDVSDTVKSIFAHAR